MSAVLLFAHAFMSDTAAILFSRLELGKHEFYF